jgi:hypothetical protein
LTEAADAIDRYLDRFPDDWLPEADDRLNDLNRQLIRAYADEYGTAWLGQINYTPDKPLWKWDGGFVYNWGASFVIPCYDETLHKLILDRRNALYTGTADDAVRVARILNRIEDLGGEHLLWT